MAYTKRFPEGRQKLTCIKHVQLSWCYVVNHILSFIVFLSVSDTLYKHTRRDDFLLFPFYWWTNWDYKELNTSSRVKKKKRKKSNDRARVQSNPIWFQRTWYCPKHTRFIQLPLYWRLRTWNYSPFSWGWVLIHVITVPSQLW